jgi:Ca-activated chloride channel homolog
MQTAVGKSVLFIIATCFSLCVSAQVKKVAGQLSSSDSADLTILNIYPDSFPNISVVFRAETRSGEPVWNLTKDKMRVKENQQNGKVISLEQISRKQPINLGIVIDHSGSMSMDYSLYSSNGESVSNTTPDNNPVDPARYRSPLENAQLAVKKFAGSFDTGKDFISITGFSSEVDSKLPLTQDVAKINAVVDSLRPENFTALYDAMYYSIEQVKNASGVNVLVVLTDGYDNSSKTTWSKVIEHSVKENIPVYIIGLGDVNKDTLDLIAKSTHGKFYYTRSSSSLDTVYALISKQVQAFYDLVYRSPSLSSADSTLQVEISFDTDSLLLITEPGVVKLPPAVLAYISKKETERKFMLYGGIAALLLISAGTLLYYQQKKKKISPVIKKIFPNPSGGQIIIEFTGAAGQLQVTDVKGQLVKTAAITGSGKSINLSDLPDGNYFATILTPQGQSNAIQFIIAH